MRERPSTGNSMPRAKGQDGKAGRMRATLECAVLDLVDGAEVAPLIRLRLEQAIRRAGLGDLLSPALQDLDRLCADVQAAKSKLNDAVGTLLSE